MSNISKTIEQSTGGIRCAAVSDVGMRRSSNQDSHAIALAEGLAQWKSHGHLFMVADGMGAHAAGELASKLATDTVPHSYFKRLDISTSEAIVAAVSEANQVIFNKGSNSVDFQGMGTTCSCLLVLPQGALAAHVGDSRVYRLRGTCFEQLTFDHSLVWEMAAAGHASEEEVPAYVPKNVITRSLGPHPTVSVDVEGPFPLQSGDRFLLCSDGLTGPLSPDLIGSVLGSLPLDEAAQTLVDLANLLGGPDNITAVVLEVSDTTQLGLATKTDPPTESLRETQKRKKSRYQILSWLLMLVTGALAAVMLVQGNLPMAFLATAGFCTVAGFSWLQYKSAGKPCPRQNAHGLRGKAPYRRHDCTPGGGSLGTLADIVRQLEDLEGHSTWEVDWKSIQKERELAHEAITQGKYETAIVAYCRAVRQLMQAVRDSKKNLASDSAVDLA